jgi:S1-C subfamily serine protease
MAWDKTGAKAMSRHQACFRERLAVILIAILMVGAAVFPARADDVGTNESQIIHRLLPTVVNIAVQKVEAINPPSATTAVANAPAVGSTKLVPEGPTTVKGYVGSGFIIDPSGLIVTNYHVVDGAFQIAVTLSDGTRLVGKTVCASRLADLALVQVQTDHPLPAAHWGNSDLLQVGDQVFAAGNPFGLGLSVAAGIVSALNRDIQNSPYDDLIQTDATLNHGNSGGPLFDMQGNVIGVDSTIISPTTGSVGLGFAIPSNSARFVVDQLRTYGWVHPGWIGVKVQTMTPWDCRSPRVQ